MKQIWNANCSARKKPEYLSRVRKDVQNFVAYFFEEYWYIDFEPNFSTWLVWSQNKRSLHSAFFEHRAELSPTFVLDQDKVNETVNLKKWFIDG